MAAHSHVHELDLKSALETLEKSEYKTTRARVSILQAMFTKNGPFSANDLHAVIARKGAKNSADVVTIYRSLVIFEELGIISRCDFSDEEAMYELRHGDHAHHHHHIICRSCQSIEPLEFCELDAQEKILKQLGYKDLNHKLEFSALCPKCASKSSAPAKRA